MASNNFTNWTVPTLSIVVETPPPIVIYPTESVPAEYNYDVYSYIIVVFVLISILGITKVAINRRQSLARKAAVRDARARQGQVPTVSGSVDANSTTSSELPSTSQSGTDTQIKVDLPPTYDEVMKTFLEAKEAAAASSERSACTTAETNPRGIDAIDVEDPPPPQYSSIKPS